MEELRGRLAELTHSGTSSNFLLHVTGGTDTRVQTSNPLPAGIAEGDQVKVTGTRYPDPPFIADSVTRIAPIVPKKLPWLWIAAGIVLCILILILVLFLNRTASVIVRAIDHKHPASNIAVQLLDSTKSPVGNGITGDNGEYTFKNLKTGTYYLVDSAGASVPVNVNGRGTIVTPLVVRSPYMWTIRTSVCFRPAPNSPITLTSSANAKPQTVQTDPTGFFTFPNLPPATYTAHGNWGRTVTAVIDGKTPPPISVLNQQAPMINCFFRGGEALPQPPIAIKPQ